jgi:hypothetical protein
MTTVLEFTLDADRKQQIKILHDMTFSAALIFAREIPVVKIEVIYTGSTCVKIESIILEHEETWSDHPIFCKLSKQGSPPGAFLCNDLVGICDDAKFTRVVCYFKIHNPPEILTYIKGSLQYSS